MNGLFGLLFVISMIAILVLLALAVIKLLKKQSAKKWVIGLAVSAAVWCGSLFGFVGTMPASVKPESLELVLVSEQEEYDVNSAICIDIVAFPENADLSGLEYITDSEEICFEKNYILTGNEEGVYQVYVTTGGLKSNVLSVEVIDKYAGMEDEIAQKEKELAEVTKHLEEACK